MPEQVIINITLPEMPKFSEFKGATDNPMLDQIHYKEAIACWEKACKGVIESLKTAQK